MTGGQKIALGLLIFLVLIIILLGSTIKSVFNFFDKTAAESNAAAVDPSATYNSPYEKPAVSKVGQPCGAAPGWIYDSDEKCINNNPLPANASSWQGDKLICRDGYKQYKNYASCQARCLDSQRWEDGACVSKCPPNKQYKDGNCIDKVDETGFTKTLNAWLPWRINRVIRPIGTTGPTREMCESECLKGKCHAYIHWDTPAKKECFIYDHDGVPERGGVTKMAGRPSHVYMRNKYY